MEYRKYRLVKSSYILASLITVLLLDISTSMAGREPEDWDTLPLVKAILSSESYIGFISSGDYSYNFQTDRYFTLNRRTEGFFEHAKKIFSRYFPSPIMQRSETIKSGEKSYTLLRTSNGEEFKTEDAYCDEGEDLHHQLRKNEKIIMTQADPCSSIGSIEIVGEQLWLGTHYEGEYGDFPGEGIVIQSLEDSKLIRKISSAEGLTGNLIMAIHRDLYTDTVWVATEWGINQIDRNLNIITSKFFYEDFDKITGEAKIFLGDRKKISNPFAVIQRWLDVKNVRDFYNAVRQIPPDIRERFTLYNFYSSPTGPFLPEEMNVLVPFFIEAINSVFEEAIRGYYTGRKPSKDFAIYKACMFNDERVLDLFVSLEKVSDLTFSCADKYARAEFMETNPITERIKFLLEREKKSLAIIKKLSPQLSQQGGVSTEDTGHTDPFSEFSRQSNIAINSAASLANMKNFDGVELIHEYFLNSNGNRTDGEFYGSVVQNFYWSDEIIPAVLAGIKKIRSSEIYRGCNFFDMSQREFMKTSKHYNARYAEGIIIALDRLIHPPDEMVRHDGKEMLNLAIERCNTAFLSQMNNEDIKKVFFLEIYPALSPTQRDIVLSLVNTASPPDTLPSPNR